MGNWKIIKMKNILRLLVLMSFKNGGVYETYLQENHVQTYRLILWLTFWSTIGLRRVAAAFQRAQERHFIHVFELPARGQSLGETGDAHGSAQVLDQLGEVLSGALPFDVGV